ncbi:MAG: NAD(P)-dependent oxidoreductase [Candidatus Dojkabacteria bacterium]|nr:NAD(P)-dependent oxidoreductase [Candidatus Dojkabacteria bacterium]
MKIYICEPKEIDQEAINLLQKNGFTLLTRVRRFEAEALFMRTYTTIDYKYLQNFPDVKYILRAGVGLDNIDRKECKSRNIEVINAPGSNANAVAEYVICMMILVSRSIILQMANLDRNLWRDRTLIGRELSGSTLGIIGCGAIGQTIAIKLRAWNLDRILGYDPYLGQAALRNFNIQKCSLSRLWRESDFITLHIPLNPETQNLITEKEISLMKETTILINASRGGIVNEKDLITALKNKAIMAAALDVYENEPDINSELIKIANLYTTPHIAALTIEAEKQMCIGPVKKLLDILSNNQELL